MIGLADYIVSFLEKENVRHVFTVSGGGSIFLDDALSKSRLIQYVCCHHEQAAAMAAESYARVRGGLGVSIVTTGPGSTNAITGVAGSWMDSVPHLVLSGQVYLGQTIGNSGLRQLGVQEINIIDIVKTITKYAEMVRDPKSIRMSLEKAVYTATHGRPGPVWLDVPADVQTAWIDESALESFSPEPKGKVQDPGLKEKISEIAELLKNAKRPLVHVGQGVKIAGAVKEFMDFVETSGIPFVTARNANDIVSSDHPLFVGRPGTFAQRPANFAIQNADLYIAVGTRLSLPQTGYHSKDFARNAKKILIDLDPSELDKKTLAIDIKICSDAGVFLREMNRRLSGARFDFSSWAAQCRRWKEKYPVVLPEYKTQKRPVNSYFFVDLLSDLLTAEDVIVTDMGIAFQGTHQAFKVKKGQKFFTNCGFAAMGWGLPAAVGACFANGKKRAVCIAGEGGLQMNIQELATVMHHRLPVKIFVLNNGGYLTIKQTQEHAFGGRLMGCNKDSGLSFPDILKIAEAHGIPAVRTDNQETLKEILMKVLDSEGPEICEIMMDPDQAQIPKVLSRKKPDGTFEPAPIEDLYPYLDKNELKQNMVGEK